MEEEEDEDGLPPAEVTATPRIVVTAGLNGFPIKAHLKSDTSD